MFDHSSNITNQNQLFLTQAFTQAMKEGGIQNLPVQVVADGKIHRFSPDGRNNQDGWYVFFGMAGAFGDWREQIHGTWRTGTSLSSIPKNMLEEQIDQAKHVMVEETIRRHTESQVQALYDWDNRFLENGTSAYLERKKVEGIGIQYTPDFFVVPLRDSDGVLWSYQKIRHDDGSKKFLSGGKKKGCFHTLGNLENSQKVYVCEGYATGASIYMATNITTLVAFDAGNLDPVVAALKQRYANVEIVIAGDDDAHKEQNTGRHVAQDVALKYGCEVVFPKFQTMDHHPIDFNDLHVLEGVDEVKKQLSHKGVEAKDLWSDPLPLIEIGKKHAYPIDTLPETIRSAVEEVIAFVQCPVSLAANSALSALSLSAQGLANVRRAHHLEGPINLFLLSIADSGERKSTCDNLFIKPIKACEFEKRESLKSQRLEYDTEKTLWEISKEELINKIKNSTKKGESLVQYQNDLLVIEKHKPQEVKVPKLLYGDVTPEALAYGLLKWPSSVILCNEAGLVFGSHSMSKDSLMRNLSLLNVLWDAQPFKVDRKGTESFEVTEARLTFGLSVQADTVRQFFQSNHGIARGIGFGARFLIAYPESTQGTRLYNNESFKFKALEDFQHRLKYLLDKSTDQLAPIVLELSPEAKETWIFFHNEVEVELRNGGDMQETRDVASKAADNAARLAALFHLLDHDPSLNHFINQDLMVRACQIITWHLYEAKRFFREIAFSDELNHETQLDTWLIDYCKNNNVQSVSTRTVHRLGPNSIRKKEVFETTLQTLIDSHRVQLHKQGTQKNIFINPKLLGEISDATH